MGRLLGPQNLVGCGRDRHPFAQACLLLLTTACAATVPAQEPNDKAAPGLDILVFAPHPDDEALNCAGVMLQALAENKRVGVVVITNGGGFPEAAAALLKKAEEDLTPADFLELARVRQNMSLESMAIVGGRASDLIFLGYPDGGLANIYHHKGDSPFRLEANGRRETYGPVVTDYHTTKHGSPAPYLPGSVLNDMVEIIRTQRPREIYVTHDADTHADHQAAFWFVRDAARMAGFTGSLLTYVGHGDQQPDLPVRRVQLTAQERNTKNRAIGAHKLPVVHDTLGDDLTDQETFWVVSPGP